MISLGNLVVKYSGGASNILQQDSLGGVMTTAGNGAVISQIPSTTGPMTGLTILDARGNTEGIGTVRWTPSTNSLLWKPFGAVAFNGVVLSTDGIYTIGTSAGYLIVSVVIATLPAIPRDELVTIVGAMNKTFDNVSPLESLEGRVEYRCFYMHNTASVGTAYDVRMWIKNQPIGDDTLSIALHPGGKNTNASVIADEIDSTDVLSAITWVAPSTQGAGLVLGDLSPGDRYAFWVRRTVPENTLTQVVNNKSSIGFSALM